MLKFNFYFITTDYCTIFGKNFKLIDVMKTVPNKLRVLHFPQIPCTPFFVDVKDEEQAYLIQETLANQHLFLFDNNFIPDYSNIITVVMWDENSDGNGTADWVNYYNEEEGMEFDEFAETYLIKS